LDTVNFLGCFIKKGCFRNCYIWIFTLGHSTNRPNGIGPQF
jgi:hypothetical protein